MMSGNSSGVTAVERAASILEAFTERDYSLSLSELSRRTGLDKSTVLRIARSLAKFSLLVRNDDASWRLGSKLIKLGNIYKSTFRISDVVEPLLAELASKTGESVAIYVREGHSRICLYRHDSYQSIRHSARLGDALPLNLGAPGRVILAFSDHSGAVYEEIRAKGYCATFGERDPQVASLAVPIFKEGQVLFGSMALTGPPARFNEDANQRNLEILKQTAAKLTRALGGE